VTAPEEGSTPPDGWVHIHYHRPPGRRRLYVQALLMDTPQVQVTLARNLSFDPPMRIHGEVVLESGSDVVWFTFPGRWHDIGRFHRADGTFTGWYANLLTPVEMEAEGRVWRTTDLFLDVWMGRQGPPLLLDEAELDEAEGSGWVDPGTAGAARREAEGILRDAREGRWPPPVAREWTRARALQAMAERERRDEPFTGG